MGVAKTKRPHLPDTALHENTTYFQQNVRSETSLSAGHFLGHIQHQLAVVFVGLAQQTANFVEKTRIFANAAPSDVVTRLALWEVGQLRRFLAVVEELIERHFECASQLLQRFNGRHSMAIFHAGNVATE